MNLRFFAVQKKKKDYGFFEHGPWNVDAEHATSDLFRKGRILIPSSS